MIRPIALLALAACLGTASCSSPPPEPYSSADLAAARRAFAAGDSDGAWDELSDWEREYFDRISQGEFSLLAGDVAYARGDWDDAIKHYEEYLLFEGAGEPSARVENRLFELGEDLVEERRKILGIFSDKSRGVVTLQNLATWAPRSPRAPEALATTGEYHFREAYYNRAADDYRMILQFYPYSEWGDLAAFRIGMCSYSLIDGAEVSGRLIDMSLAQLRHYLQQFPSGLYREEAELAVADLEELSAAHLLGIGDYYEDIGNIRGARRGFRQASARTGTKASVEAKRRLEALPAEDPPLPERTEDDD